MKRSEVVGLKERGQDRPLSFARRSCVCPSVVRDLKVLCSSDSQSRSIERAEERRALRSCTRLPVLPTTIRGRRRQTLARAKGEGEERAEREGHRSDKRIRKYVGLTRTIPFDSLLGQRGKRRLLQSLRHSLLFPYLLCPEHNPAPAPPPAPPPPSASGVLTRQEQVLRKRV